VHRLFSSVFWLYVRGFGAHVGPEDQNGAIVGVLCGCRECRWLGGDAPGDAPEDHGSGLLNGFQALAQQISVSVPSWM